jgi:SAM-dependent methyltransferase
MQPSTLKRLFMSCFCCLCCAALLIGSYRIGGRERLPATFDRIYRDGQWGKDAEGRGISGSGSTLEKTQQYRAYLESFIKEHQVASVVDAGCGDWSFSRKINWGSARYLGVDISRVIIDRVKQQFGNQQFTFQWGDITDPLPAADLLICKDVLQHLSNQKIQRFIRNNLQPGKYKWVLITNDRDAESTTDTKSINAEIEDGDWHRVDLSKAPFGVQGLVDLPIQFGDEYMKVTQLLSFAQ